MPTTTRRRTSTQLKLLEALPALGAAIALATTPSGATAPGNCTGDAARCVGDSMWASFQPYFERALGGACVGLALAMVAILALRSRGAAQPAAAPRREAIPERVRHEVWRRDRGTCVECGSRGRLEFDHIIPVSRGGANTVRNIELRCEPCNRRKGARV
jgi:hypothetical protein